MTILWNSRASSAGISRINSSVILSASLLETFPSNTFNHNRPTKRIFLPFDSEHSFSRFSALMIHFSLSDPLEKAVLVDILKVENMLLKKQFIQALNEQDRDSKRSKLEVLEKRLAKLPPFDSDNSLLAITRLQLALALEGREKKEMLEVIEKMFEISPEIYEAQAAYVIAQLQLALFLEGSEQKTKFEAIEKFFGSHQ